MDNTSGGTYFESVSVEIIGGVVASLIVIALVWVGPRAYRSLRRKRADRREAAAGAKAQVESDALRVLREQVIEVAKARHIRLPEKWKKTAMAMVVTYTDGDVIEFYRDFPAMKRDMQSGHASIQARMGSPDKPVSVWDEPKCTSWLEDNASAE